MKRFRVVDTAGKVMALMFRDSKGIVFIDYMLKGQTTTGPYYVDLIPKVREPIKEKPRGKLSMGVLFLHENAPAHRSEVALKVIHIADFNILDHPPCYPDLAPSDYHLFPKLKEHILGTKFDDDDAVIAALHEPFRIKIMISMRKE